MPGLEERRPSDLQLRLDRRCVADLRDCGAASSFGHCRRLVVQPLAMSLPRRLAGLAPPALLVGRVRRIPRVEAVTGASMRAETRTSRA